MKYAPRIVIRVDADNRSGFGHLSRCVNIVRHFLEITQYSKSCILFIGNFIEFSEALLSSYNFSFLSASNPGELEKVLEEEAKRGAAILIDSYQVDQKILDELCNLFQTTIIVDDSCQLEYSKVDLLINFRYSAESLFSPNARSCALGASYFVTRPELLSLRNSNTTVKPQVKKMLIFMGGGYVNVETVQKVIDISRQIQPEIDISCVSNQVEMKALRGAKPLGPTMEIEVLLSDCDICINGGGLIKYECVFSRVPSASLSTTELQDEDTKILAGVGLIQDLGMDVSKGNKYLQSRLGDILGNHSMRRSLLNASSTLFDSNSAEKLVQKIRAVI